MQPQKIDSGMSVNHSSAGVPAVNIGNESKKVLQDTLKQLKNDSTHIYLSAEVDSKGFGNPKLVNAMMDFFIAFSKTPEGKAAGFSVQDGKLHVTPKDVNYSVVVNPKAENPTIRENFFKAVAAFQKNILNYSKGHGERIGRDTIRAMQERIK